jgi:hypothetical protein
MAVTLATSVVSARAEALRTLLNTGAAGAKIKIYSGDGPGGPDATATGTLLAEVPVTYPIPAATAGVLRLTPSADATVITNGVAGWARVVNSAGAALLDLVCGTDGSGADLILSSQSLFQGGSVRVTLFTIA